MNPFIKDMLWRWRQDFVSLFTRGDSSEDYFHPIDGLRSIANISVILLHLVTIFSTFRLPYPHTEWIEYINSTAFVLIHILPLSLEIFFMVSGFLLTYKLTSQWKKNATNFDLFLRKEYPISILKRALRFWPGMLLVVIIMFIFGEPSYPNSSYAFEFFRHFSIWMFFQNYIDLEYCSITFGSLWTNSLDMQIHIILPLLLYLFYSYRKFLSIYTCLIVLLITSIIQGLIVFKPKTMSISSVMYRYPSLPVVYPNYLNHWIESNYNVTLPMNIPNSNSAKLFMQKMYYPLEARFGSFIIGAILAIKLITNSTHHNKSKMFKNIIMFSFSLFSMLSILRSSNFSSSSDLLMTLGIAFSRQLFTIGLAFILFTSLCPSSHSYHSIWIEKFLSSSIWIPISKLSYLVYIIHWRISVELVFAGPLRFLTTYSVTYAIFISLPIVLVITLFISCIWYVIIEKPIERVVKIYFQKNSQCSKIHLK